METNVMTRPTMDEWDKRQKATAKKAARKAGKKAPQAKRGEIGSSRTLYVNGVTEPGR